MLLAWDRFDDFMALPIKTELSSVAQALKDRHDRLAPASVIEGELVVTCPQQTPAEAPGETTTDSTVEAAAEAIGVESPKVAAEITSFDGNGAPVEAAPSAPTEAAVGILVTEAEQAASPELAAEIPRQDSVEAAEETTSSTSPRTAVEMLKSDRTEEVAAATSSTPLERVAETPTDDCI